MRYRGILVVVYAVLVGGGGAVVQRYTGGVYVG